MCRAPVGMVTMGLDGVTHIPNAGALVAHEMGHILGNARQLVFQLCQLFHCKK
jgi:hypothetical protein